VLFLFLTTHGSQARSWRFELPPLVLHQLTPKRIGADVERCWRQVEGRGHFGLLFGSFVEPLRDENTLVITAADATHASFGCEVGSDFTWFSKAYFDEALRARDRSSMRSSWRAGGGRARAPRRTRSFEFRKCSWAAPCAPTRLDPEAAGSAAASGTAEQRATLRGLR